MNNHFSDKIYWLNQLTGELPDTGLIKDYLSIDSETAITKSINFALPELISRKIVNYADNSLLSVYLLLLSVVNLLVYKYTGTNDLIIGSPVYQSESNSNQVIPLRFQIQHTINFQELVLQVKEVALRGYFHQDYSLNNNFLFPIVVGLKNIHSLNLDTDLQFFFEVKESEIKGKVDYNSQLYKPSQINCLVNQYIYSRNITK